MPPHWLLFVIPTWLGGSVMMQLLPSWGLGPVEELRRATLLILAVFGLTMAGLFLSAEASETSRVVLTFAFCFSALLIPLMRIHVKRLLIRWDAWGIPVAIYGAPEAATQLLQFFEQERGLGYRPVIVFEENDSPAGAVMRRVRSVKDTEATKEAIVAILATHRMAPERRQSLMEGPLAYYRTVLLIPDLPDSPSLWIRPRDLNGILGLELPRNITSPVYNSIKRGIDLLLVVGAAPVWIPFMFALAILIWKEDGVSPFFMQERIGKDGKVFFAMKFRTMVPEAEKVLARHLARDAALRAEWHTSFKLRHDPRITRAGSYLRRYSLDELPQLVNVLFGHMSLVGPRPLPSYHHLQLSVSVRDLRERVRPGLTGVWQVSGRSDIGTDGMERWDTYYVRNWSPWMDIVVIFRTFRTVIRGTGAY